MKRSVGALCAAGSMFTRLPFGRLMRLEREDYEQAIDWWPVVGLITGGAMASVFVLVQSILPVSVAIVLAFGARLLLTAGFHEDGLGDFFDGFGGGGSRERILAIMKDSHVGSYAVLGYIVFYALIWAAYWELAGLDVHYTACVMLYADVLGKWTSGGQVQWLPYARNAETSKTGIVYRKSRLAPRVVGLLLVLFFLPWFLDLGQMCFLLVGSSVLLGVGLMWYIKRKIGGYTGDTCGAICLLAELTVVLIALAHQYTSTQLFL